MIEINEHDPHLNPNIAGSQSIEFMPSIGLMRLTASERVGRLNVGDI